MKIYTAGDMRSGWQDQLAVLLPVNFTLIDPRSHGFTDPAKYTEWDLDGVARADAMVAYMGPHNPSGFGLSLEAGYAHALGKPIVFVDCLGADWRSRYFDILRHISVVVHDFESAAAELERFA